MPILNDFRYHAPGTVGEVLRILKKKKGATVLAGGTFLLNMFKKAHPKTQDVVSLRRVPSLRGIAKTKGTVSIGAMTTISELLDSAVIREHFPSLREACRHLGTTPLRNMATIGGNVASRFFWVDLPAVLVSLDARAVLATGRGKKTSPIGAYLVSKSSGAHLLTHIEIPCKRSASFYYRHTKTMEVDTPSLAMAFAAVSRDASLEDVRIVVNTVTSRPCVCEETAAVFEKKKAADMSLGAASAALRADLAATRLDEGRQRLLILDIEDLIGRLKAASKP